MIVATTSWVTGRGVLCSHYPLVVVPHMAKEGLLRQGDWSQLSVDAWEVTKWVDTHVFTASQFFVASEVKLLGAAVEFGIR